MKTSTFLKCLTVAAAVACAATFQVAAQPGGGGGGRGFRGMVLNQDQMQQMRDALPPDSPEMTALTTKLAAAQKEAINAALAKDATDDSVKAKLEAVAKIQTEIAMLRYSKAVKPMAASVTDDQKSQIDSSPNPAFTYMMMFGERGGFGRGGRRGGGGGGGAVVINCSAGYFQAAARERSGLFLLAGES